MVPTSLSAARRLPAGMTLVEVAVVLAIVGTLVCLAAPPMRDMLLRQRMVGVRSELSTALQWARWEAVRRNTPVSLQRRTDCLDALTSVNDWPCGWAVVIHVAGLVQELQVFDLPDGVRLVHAGGGNAVQFERNGMPTLVAHRFTIESSRAPVQHLAALCMNRSGRVRTVTGQATC
jgi:prepilin-type N-terminal cleavage/methylation domain-containing protein